MAATHELAFTMGAGHRRVHLTARLPRAIIYCSCEFSPITSMEDSEGQIAMKASYELLYESGRREFTMSFVRQSFTSAMHFGEGSLFAGKTCMRRVAWVSPLLLLWFRAFSLALCCCGVGTLDPVSMVRERARSRRGSAWDAHRAQRRRK
jgi:hypothetical protein